MRIAALALAFTLGACASAGASEPSGPPSLALTPGVAAPAHARFYGECISQAQANGAYDREEGWLRYTCTGDVARAFYDALGAFSARMGSEYRDGARTLRFTTALQRDTVGTDHCVRDGDQYTCRVVLRVGEFLDN